MNNELADGPQLPTSALRLLDEAAAYLETPTFLTRVANLAGRPAEALLRRLPERTQRMVSNASTQALRRGLNWAIRSLPATLKDPTARHTVAFRGVSARFLDRHGHTALTALSGAGGGFFGLAGLPVEIPATTVLMLRSIARIAADEGFDLNDPATRLDCLSVLSFGSPALEEMESAYFTARLGLALSVRQAAAFVSTHTVSEVAEALARGTAPWLMRLLYAISSRFQMVVSAKAAAQAVPLAGAALGALVNASFTDHFNRVARFHFQILNLERRHGRDTVRQAYHAACRAHGSLAGA